MVMVRVDVDHPSILLSIDVGPTSIDNTLYVGTMYSNISEKDESQTNQKTIFYFISYLLHYSIILSLFDIFFLISLTKIN